MRKYIYLLLLSAGLLSSCGEYTKVLKNAPYDYKYEAAKSYFASGELSKSAQLLEELNPVLKGTRNGEECLYMLAMTYYNMQDYVTASHYFNTYYTTYPRGIYTELARFYCGKSLVLDTPEARLDQSSTVKAILELQMFIEYFPYSSRKSMAQDLILEMQNKLVEKEYLAASLYYDLGSYSGNASYTSTGNNYQAAVITAQNVLKEYPYTSRREDLSILILRAKYGMAKESVLEKKEDRMRETIDEYYAFINEFPESKYKKEVEGIFKDASKYVEKK